MTEKQKIEINQLNLEIKNIMNQYEFLSTNLMN